MTISIITKEFNQKTGKTFSNCFIRSMMKHKIGYSYRTISNRVPNFQTKKNKMMKVLFWTEQMSLLYSRIILVKIDESSFDRLLYKRYSWLPLQSSKISITSKLGEMKSHSCNIFRWKLVCLRTKRNPFIIAFLLIFKALDKSFKRLRLI